jgi:hypothetical protein
MQKASYIKLSILSCATFLLLKCGGESNKKAPPTPEYSQTIADSKKNGVFQFEVAADKPSLVLNSELKFEIKEAWVENEWYTQNYVFGKQTMEKVDSTYQLILKLSIDIINKGSSNGKYFYFIGNKHLDTFIYHNCQNYYSHRIDTIKVPLYKEISDELPSRKDRRAFDTLTFVKRIVIR